MNFPLHDERTAPQAVQKGLAATRKIFEFLLPTLESFNGLAVVIFGLALLALFRFHIGVIPVILGSIVAGLAITWLV